MVAELEWLPKLKPNKMGRFMRPFFVVDCMKSICYTLNMSKLIQLVKTQIQWQKLPELDQQIVRAEKDLFDAYVRWQKLLASRDAERNAKQEVSLMIRDVYQEHQFDV